jgi:RNA polymerase sigma-70 factor (ECF subfamily)
LEDALECVNDTWLSAWNVMPPKRPDRLSAFLGKITRNLSINRYKAGTTQKRGGGQMDLALTELEECIPDKNSIDEAIDQMTLTTAIDSFLHKQPQQKRMIFVRRYWYLSSIDEIAKDYGMSRSKTTSLLFRMRNELKEHLEMEGIYL